MTVADTAIKKGLKAGLALGLGAAMIEFFQSFIAIKFTYLFAENPKIDFYFNAIALVAFFCLAIFYLFFAKTADPNTIKTNEKDLHPFFKGILISSMNVLVFPYWIFYGKYLNSNGWLNLETYFIALFSLGIMLGAFSVFFIFAKLGILILKRGPQLMQYVNKAIGLIFLGFGIFQIYKVFGL